ncbi:MAG: KpsF/GutQ family sugar-phosphate isomerase [Alphaproteobacteria bacterium]|nr:KpsF/GutQ family sugar-phosphate isomerase [Alphaproteobacteria bacterium]
MSDTAEHSQIAADNRIASARRTLQVEADGLKHLSASFDGLLGAAFIKAIEAIENASGRVIVCGVGKSGHIARKIASTFSSTGTAAYYVHPTEASHGDLGMIAPDDVLLTISNSGETAELRDILSYSRRFAVPLIALTSKRDSALGAAADIVLELPRHAEACPNGLAPTTSTTLQLALGDALAIALLENKGFSPNDFKVLHPGGRLGASLSYVRDVMHGMTELPLVKPETVMSDTLVIMTSKRFGCAGVIDGDGNLVGVITDGDLRRHMKNDLLGNNAGTVMTRDPVVSSPDDLASAVLEMLNSRKITSLFVTEQGKPVGIVHIHDILRLGVQ